MTAVWSIQLTNAQHVKPHLKVLTQIALIVEGNLSAVCLP